MTAEAIAAVVVALQFTAFGWRISREIAVGDEGRRTWLPMTDYLNILAMFGTVGWCLVMPLLSGEFGDDAKAMLAVAATLVGFHPVNTAAHYGLLTGRGRARYLEGNGDYPYATDEEILSTAVTVVVAALVAWRFI